MKQTIPEQITQQNIPEVGVNDIVMRDIEKEYEEFVYIVSHDLNAPLRHMREFTKLLVGSAEDKLDMEEKSYIDFIQISLNRLDAMQSALLNLSRVNTSSEEKKKINAQELIEKSIGRLEMDSLQTNPQITFGAMPVIDVEPKIFENVFYQLIDNACRYGYPDGEQRVHISAHDKGPEVVFEIQDNGIGIDASFCEVIFTMFRRLHNQDEYGGGVGAGLTIVKKSIENHGGHIWIKSQLDEGARVLFSVPKKQ